MYFSEDIEMSYSTYHQPDWDQYEDYCDLQVRQLPNLKGKKIEVAMLTFYETKSGNCIRFMGEYCSERLEDSITNMIRHGRVET
ncbi:hypothetical protein GPB2148_1427 [marine gamma proteobacterium HTCC2148]|nr:hypothetical protein GPB2148_1427 [marine gamma proteobacterium HTCC2148]